MRKYLVYLSRNGTFYATTMDAHDFAAAYCEVILLIKQWQILGEPAHIISILTIQ